MLMNLGLVIQYIIIIFILIQVLYLFVFSLAGALAKRKVFENSGSFRRIRIFIPGYKEDAVIISTAKAALLQDYPKQLFEVVIIADSFTTETLETLRSLDVRVIEVSFDKSTKGKALQKAISVLQNDPVDILLILDADNQMSKGFLHAVNSAFHNGYEVLQGHRTSKSNSTTFALLDACSEEINNHILRRGHSALGLPSALIGSGMAFSWDLFISLIQDIGETAGEDKELEFRLARLHKDIAFLDGYYVYDEKVANTAVFSKQRTRWLGAQLECFKKYFAEGWIQLFKGNFHFFNKAFQTIILPRVMLIGVCLLWLLFTIFFAHALIIYAVVIFLLLSVSLILGVPKRWYNLQLLYAVLQIPAAIIGMMKSLLNINKARNQFIHTPHSEIHQQN